MSDNYFNQFLDSDSTQQAATQQQPTTDSTTGQGIDNYFSQFTVPGKTQQQISVENNAETTNGWQASFMAGVDNMNRQFEKASLATMQIGAQLSSHLGGGKQMQDFSDSLNQINKDGTQNGLVIGENQAAKSFSEHPIAGSVGTVAGFAGNAIALGGTAKALGTATGITSSILGKVAQNTLLSGNPILHKMTLGALSGIGAGAGYGLLQPADTLGGHLTNAGTGMAIGGALGATIPLATEALKGIKNTATNYVTGRGQQAIDAMNNQSPSSVSATQRAINPQQAAVSDVAYDATTTFNPTRVGVTDTAKLDSTLNDFNKLGMKATPGEAFGSKSQQAVEAALPIGPRGKAVVANLVTPRAQQLQDKIKESIATMAPADVHAFKDKAYHALESTTISDGAANNLLAQPTIKNLFDDIPTDIDVGKLSANHLTKWDSVVQNINDKLWNDKHSLDTANKLATTTVTQLQDARNTIIKTLESEHGATYIPARQAAQKVAIQNNYMNLLSKVPNEKGQPLSLSGGIDDAIDNTSRVNAVLFGTPDKASAFLKDVKTVGGDVEATKSLINVSNIVSNSQITKLLSKSPASLSNLGTDAKSIVKGFADAIINGSYKDAMLKLTVSGQQQWLPLIKREIIRQSTPQAKTMGFMKIVGSIAKSITQETAKLGNTVSGPVLGTVAAQSNQDNTQN